MKNKEKDRGETPIEIFKRYGLVFPELRITADHSMPDSGSLKKEGLVDGKV